MYILRDKDSYSSGPHIKCFRKKVA